MEKEKSNNKNDKIKRVTEITKFNKKRMKAMCMCKVRNVQLVIFTACTSKFVNNTENRAVSFYDSIK